MSGRWTDEEHQGFLHGLEVYGYGNWDAIAVFVPSRSPPQIEAYAQQYVAQGVPQGHGGGAGSGGSHGGSSSNGSGAGSPGGASPFAAQQQYQHQAQYQQQHQAQQQPEEQHQQRQVWSRTGLVPVANNPDSEQEMRRQLDTNGVCYGML